MKKQFVLLLLISICLTGAISNLTGQNHEEGETINWLTLEEVAEKSKDEPRKIIMDVYTDWCGW